ncbi:UNVERIFIED_CONTAM: hypothetical protein PYX00_007373 [Menopon gallinae]|uniref:Lysosomal protein NCU-G1 n=1 Tax=Menopon gallinae TaxID=328185 RepID=A0AAW2HIT4_9NEOP
MKCLIFLLFLTTANSLRRLLTMEKTPGCPNCKYPLYYTRAQGPNDTLHYIWDFYGKPTMFVALTEPNATATFNWTEYAALKQSVSFDSEPHYTFALVVNNVIEFNDVDDTGIMTPSTESVSYDTQRFAWTVVALMNGTSEKDFVSLDMRSTNYTDGMMSLAGNVIIQLSAFGLEGHDFLQPRLVHTANTTQCRIIMDGLRSNTGYNASRFAVEFITVSSDSKNDSSTIESRMNLDDENSPGVFSVVDLTTPQSQNHLYKGVFLQWRPVAFTYEIPSLVNSTEVLTYNVTDVLDPKVELKDTFVYRYYGSDLNNQLIQQTVVSLGFAEDGFYKKTNYSSWTFTINYGSPETEKFSLLVIMVMAIGLGFPVVLILIGGSYMLGRRLRNKNEITLTR